MMELGIFEILISLAVILVLWYFNTFKYDYWEKLGVSGPRASPPFGNFTDVFIWKKFATDKVTELYRVYEKERFFGYFVGRTPLFVINDLDLVKQVLIKDFNIFSERGVTVNENVDPLSSHLFNIGGKRWQILRPRLSQFFSTGKLKRMFNLMVECADHFEGHLTNELEKNEVIECREHAARYTTDVIGSCAFGIKTQALAEECSIFRKIGRKTFESSYMLQLKRLLRQVEPNFFSFFQINTVPSQMAKLFLNIINKTMKMREQEEQNVRKDLIDILMRIPNDSIAVNGCDLTPNLLVAQAFGFFAAGFEMSSATMSFALWELARHPEVQERLRQEIVERVKKSDGKITYGNVSEMKYLDMVVNESLRKNSQVGIISRKVMNDYLVPGTSIVLPAGQLVQIPVHAVHHDPKYYPNPEIFDPERFTNDAKKARHPMAFLSFGHGPKSCIGTRFGYYQVKVGLIKVIQNFRVHPTTKFDDTYTVDQNSIVLKAIEGLRLKFERLDS